MTSAERVVQVLLNWHGRLYSEVLGLDLRPGSASVLFQWLCASLLLGGRIPRDGRAAGGGSPAAPRLDPR